MATQFSGVVAALIEMGFAPEEAEKAHKATGSEDVQVAMDWILNHSSVAQEEEEPAQPKSLKCEDCGKILRSELDVQAHAVRTGHQNFVESTEEIKPLTPEEKAAQVAKLEEKMKEKRAAREEQEKMDIKEREKLRRKGGKELTEIKQKMELAEMKKLAEDRKRQKYEDRIARQKVKEQIARDREVQELQSKNKPTIPTQAQPTVEVKKDYTTCRLQIRLVDGTTKTLSLSATATFQDVLTQLGSPSAKLMTTFPKRIFTSADVGSTLKELGLVPSAVLIQTPNTQTQNVE